MEDSIQILLDKSLSEEQEAVASYLSRAQEVEVSNPKVSALFKELARDEQVHIAQLRKAKELLGYVDQEVEDEGSEEAEEILNKGEFDMQIDDDVLNILNEKIEITNEDTKKDMYLKVVFGENELGVIDLIRPDIDELVEEQYLTEEEFKIEDIKLYGSYTTGKAHKDSDLDVVILYSGEMREDDAFNMLNDTKLEITDLKGNQIPIDINPISNIEYDSIEQYFNYLDSLEPKSV